MPNPIVRWQIVSPDPEKTARFYAELFGWDRSQENGLGYRELRTGLASPGPVDGGVWPSSAPGQPPFAQLFVAVEDIDLCLARAEQLGARLLVPKSTLPDGDTMAVLLDPLGLAFGVCTLRP